MLYGELNLTQCGTEMKVHTGGKCWDIQIGQSLCLIFTPEQAQALKRALSSHIPATLETFGKTQCNWCRKIIRVKEVVDSERYAAYPDTCFKHLCKECRDEMDKPCTCARPCDKCDDYDRCGGCKMPPCEECKANEHLIKEAN